jgi:hypothetical protein
MDFKEVLIPANNFATRTMTNEITGYRDR